MASSRTVDRSGESGLTPELVRAVRAGERRAFDELVRLVTPRVRQLAMRFFQSPFDQEEAVQESFLLLYRQRERLDPLRVDTTVAFVATLTRRRMIDLLRARGVEAVADDTVDPSDERSEADRPAQDQELVALMEHFEAKLKPAYRPFFRAVFVEGKDFAEARTALGLGALRAKYLKKVLLGRLRRHGPLLEYLGRPR